MPKKGGLGQFADLRGGLGKKEGVGVFFRGGWYPNAHYDIFDMAAQRKVTWKVFRISGLLPSDNKIYCQLFMGGDKFSRCFSQENT